LETADSKPEYPVILTSCLTGEGKKEFLSIVGDIASDLLGKKNYRIEFPCEEYNKRFGWLIKNAGISNEEDFEYVDDKIIITVKIDHVTY
jgi:hypothetical protein